MPKSEKLVVLEARLTIAKKYRDMHLCRLLLEAVTKQSKSDYALLHHDFNSVEQLDAEVRQLEDEVCLFSYLAVR